ncbi:uncharacterized protein LOC113449933 [Pseudonaja textilis]|uniref:uncharacterized protein LOC113449933 n=1 Tax=Pseudonaja textilis TaxID=8673 RepID=UPI000EA9DAC8|nr:uncharacterized protein LOC113449933 [Pseudonaja textilis]
MAMQEHLRIKERHRCSITALGYHSARRECLTGFEDGVIKWWDMGSGHMTLCSKEHAGWITHFLSWIQARLLFSASNDSSVLVWAPGGTVLDRILLGYPIFTLAISLTRHLLLCGSKGRLTVFPLDEKRESGHTVNITQSFSEWTHKDIVSCITCLDNHIYTAGYDKKLLIFDTYQTLGRKGLTKKQCISRAHNAAITHLILVRQQETTRVLSGSFDQTVGIWSQDGKLIQRLGPFSSNITGLCYVAPIGVIWITSGTSQPTLYEPQSGEIGNFDNQTLVLDRVIFVEQLDILVMSATNGSIYLWEFETFIPGAQPIVQQNKSALDQDSKILGKDCAQDKMVCDPSSSCISDLICRIVLCGHTGMITALALVTDENGVHAPYLLSGGWDGRLCLWNLQKRSFQNAFSNLPGDNGPILDVACSQNRREFAFSTSTGVFICAFNFHCADLELMAELCGHKITVLALAWHPQQNKWVTGAEDGTIQVWSKDGGCCVRNMKAPRGITCICIDQINGCIMAGEHDTIRYLSLNRFVTLPFSICRIYDPNSGALVQSYTGHQDSIKGLIHVPEMKQYVSVSLDGTARIWKAYHQGG